MVGNKSIMRWCPLTVEIKTLNTWNGKKIEIFYVIWAISMKMFRQNLILGIIRLVRSQNFPKN